MGVTQGGSEVGGQGLTRGVLGSSMWVTASPAAPQQKALWGTSSSHPFPTRAASSPPFTASVLSARGEQESGASAHAGRKREVSKSIPGAACSPLWRQTQAPHREGPPGGQVGGRVLTYPARAGKGRNQAPGAGSSWR